MCCSSRADCRPWDSVRSEHEVAAQIRLSPRLDREAFQFRTPSHRSPYLQDPPLGRAGRVAKSHGLNGRWGRASSAKWRAVSVRLTAPRAKLTKVLRMAPFLRHVSLVHTNFIQPGDAMSVGQRVVCIEGQPLDASSRKRFQGLAGGDPRFAWRGRRSLLLRLWLPSQCCQP